MHQTIDATSGPGRMNLSKTDRPAIFLISVTKVSFNLLFKEYIGAEQFGVESTPTTPRTSAPRSVIYRVWRGVVFDPLLG